MKMIKLLLLFVFSFAFTNCQKEEEEIIDQTPVPENIIVGSPLAKLISRTAQNPTECDNVLDNNSCFSIQLPVTVTVNGIQTVVTTEAGYQTVKNIKDAYTTDNDIVYFSYPITIKFKNFSSQIITSYNDLQTVILNCPSDDGLNEIDCITINYPIVVNVYNTNNQIANTVTIQNNSQLYSFINGLTSSVIAAIVYPISVTSSSGQNVVINSNTELENFIESSIDDCDDSLIVNPPFTTVLTTGNWYVSYFYENDEDYTSDYNGYVFTFNDLVGSTNVTYNSSSSNGTWSTYTSSGYNIFVLSFDDSNLAELEEDWIIIEYTTTIIRLKTISGGSGDTHYLNLTKN